MISQGGFFPNPGIPSLRSERFSRPPSFVHPTHSSEGPSNRGGVDIEDLRSTISKKADLATPCSTDNVDAKTKSSLNFSAKASQIIDDVLMGRAPASKVPADNTNALTETSCSNTASGKQARTEEKAELLEKVNKLSESNKQRAILLEKAKRVRDRTQATKVTRISKPLAARGGLPSHRDHDVQVHNTFYNPDNDGPENYGRTTKSSGNMTGTAPPEEDTTRDTPRSRRRIPSVTISPQRAARRPSGGQSPRIPILGSPRKSKEMSQEDWRKLVLAPRSRKEQRLVENILKKYSKSKQASRPKLAQGSDQPCDPDAPLSISDLPEDIQMEIAQLLEREVETSETDTEVMEIRPVSDDVMCGDSNDDLERVLTLGDEQHSPSEPPVSTVGLFPSEQSNAGTSPSLTGSGFIPHQFSEVPCVLHSQSPHHHENNLADQTRCTKRGLSPSIATRPVSWCVVFR